MKKVLFVNWDSYPNFQVGGIYIWEKLIIENLKNYEFQIVNVLSSSNSNGEFKLPENVTKVLDFPLFGSYRYEEYAKNISYLPKVLRTRNDVIENRFIPLFKDFLCNLISPECKPQDFSNSIFNMHKFLMKYDGKKCLEHQMAWEAFLDKINEDAAYSQMKLTDVSYAFKTFQKFLQIFSIDVPKVDLVHCSQAWFPAMVSIIAKMKYKCPVIVTEHGVALRELMLYYNGVISDVPSSIFWNNVSTNIVKTIYWNADAISPVCMANARWESKLGVEESKLKVVYNGVDINKFKPRERKKDSKYTVVYMGRIDSWKDTISLLHGINYAREKVPLRCLIYGVSNHLEYAMKCEEVVKELHLQDTVKFMGQTSEPEKVYGEADVVVTTSVAEGFPLWLIEAMSCGKAVVSTNVGGVSEVLEGCGLLVKTVHPKELANSIVSILQDKNMKKRFEDDSVKRIKDGFSLEHNINQYKSLYENLTIQKGVRA